MTKLRIGLSNKKRGNFAIQEKVVGAGKVIDTTADEVVHQTPPSEGTS